jgi:hypothetical protein
MEETRQKTMQPESQERLPNWSPIMDLDVAQPTGSPGITSLNRPSIFITSGRQPHGAVTELRIGCEAKVSLEADVSIADELVGAYGLWAFPDPLDSHSTYIFLSYPGATTTWHFSSDQEVTPVDVNAECNSATLLVRMVQNRIMLQITETSIATLPFLASNGTTVKGFRAQLPAGSTVVDADFDEQFSAIVVAVRTDEQVQLCLYSLLDSGSITAVADSFTFTSNADLTCLCLFKTNKKLFVVAGLRDSSLQLFLVDMASGLIRLGVHNIEAFASTQAQPIGESIMVLTIHDDESGSSSCLITCGLRDGNLYTVELIVDEGGLYSQCLDSGFNVNADSQTDWCSTKVVNMGNSPVSLHRDGNSTSTSFALCGHDTCRLSYEKISGLSITSIWFTDCSQPDYVQPTLSALCTLPSHNSNYSVFASTDGAIIRFATLDVATRVVPRQMPLKQHPPTFNAQESAEVFQSDPGTPQRLLYSQHLHALIVATTKAELRRSKNARPPLPLWEGKRINRAIIQFIPLAYTGGSMENKEVNTRIELFPAEKVRSMIEWDLKIGSKNYCWLIVGTSVTNQDGRKTGRLWFLEPTTGIDGSVSVVLKSIKNVDAPVRALAVYDDNKIVLSQDKSLSVYGFDSGSGR